MSDDRRTVGRATLALAVIAVIVSSDSRLFNSRGVSDSAAKAVTSERHADDGDSRKALKHKGDLEDDRKYLVSRVSKRYLRAPESSLQQFVIYFGFDRVTWLCPASIDLWLGRVLQPCVMVL